MPTLDVSDVLISAEFMDSVNISRRTEGVNNYGVLVPAVTSFPNVGAVITTADPNELVRTPDMESMAQILWIVTTFQLQGPAPGYLPDIVWYLGSPHVIIKVLPYSRYGVGMIEALMGSIQYTDPAPVAEGATTV